MCVSAAGTRHPEGTWGVALQERQCPRVGQYSQCEIKLHRFKDPQTKRFAHIARFLEGVARIFHMTGVCDFDFVSEGVNVRRVNFGRLTGGILHSKFWIVDRKHVFIGSANMDWRALTQVCMCKFACKNPGSPIYAHLSFGLPPPPPLSGEGARSGDLQLLQPGKGPTQDLPVLLGDGTSQPLPATALARNVWRCLQPAPPPAGQTEQCLQQALPRSELLFCFIEQKFSGGDLGL